MFVMKPQGLKFNIVMICENIKFIKQ